MPTNNININDFFIPIDGSQDIAEIKFSKWYEHIKNEVKDYKGQYIKKDEAIYLKYCNHFAKKDDPNLVKDCFDGNLILKQHAIQVFFKIKPDKSVCTNSYYHTIEKHIIYYPRCHDSVDNICYMYDYNTLIDNGFVYKIKRDAFFIEMSNDKEKLNNLIYAKFSNIPNNLGLIEKNPIKYGFKSPSYLMTEGKKYTFGVELETIRGRVPMYLWKDLNINCVYDGSLKEEDGSVNGGEYVTGVLTGDTGFKHLKFICDTLATNCKIDKKCGIHVHLGNITFDKITLYFIYKLAYSLQDEIFSLLPNSRKNNEYCRKLPDISKVKDIRFNYNDDLIFNLNIWYDDFIFFMSRKTNDNKINKKNNHPQGSKCGYDHKTARYCWLNFVPAIFDTRENGVYSIEFRPHSATLSYNKIKNWILICMALVSVAENNKKEILECKDINLEWLLKLAYPKNYTRLIRYVNERKSLFSILAIDSESSEYNEKININNKSLKELIEE